MSVSAVVNTFDVSVCGVCLPNVSFFKERREREEREEMTKHFLVPFFTFNTHTHTHTYSYTVIASGHVRREVKKKKIMEKRGRLEKAKNISQLKRVFTRTAPRVHAS